MKKTLLLAILTILVTGTTSAGESGQTSQPFALLSLKLEGCASCEGCRTAMRQVVQQEAKASRIKLNGMTLVATFDQAAKLPVGNIAKSLEASASHRFSVTKIMLSVSGTKVTENQNVYLKVAETGQLFHLAGKGVENFEDGSRLTVSGTLRNWNDRSPLLEASKIERTNLQ
jgi:hypothetical protein